MEQMFRSDKTRGMKEMKIKGNERQSEIKGAFFSKALQLMSGQKVTIYTPVAMVRLKEPSRDSNSCHCVSNPPLY